MTPILRFDGIYTPVVTPYDDSGAVDYDALAAVIDHLVEAGVHGLISGGSTGENYTQTVTERLELARFTRERLDGRLPLIVGTGAMLTADSLALASGAREMGADAILVASPPYAVPTERENALNVLAIDRAADLPIMLYNYPGRTGVNMGDEFLDRVGRSRNVCAIKESSGDINRVHSAGARLPAYPDVLRHGRPGARVLCLGRDAAGSARARTSCPPSTSRSTRPARSRAISTRGRRIMSAMMPLMRVLEQGGKFIQCVKYGVEMAGLTAGPPRPPLKALNKDDKRQLEQVVRVLKRTIAEIETGKLAGDLT